MTFIPLTNSLTLLTPWNKGYILFFDISVTVQFFFPTLLFLTLNPLQAWFYESGFTQRYKVGFSIYIWSLGGFVVVVVVVKSEVKSRYSPCIHGWCLYWTPFALGSSLSRDLISDLLYENQCYYCKVHLAIKFQITALGI